MKRREFLKGVVAVTASTALVPLSSKVVKSSTEIAKAHVGTAKEMNRTKIPPGVSLKGIHVYDENDVIIFSIDFNCGVRHVGMGDSVSITTNIDVGYPDFGE